MSKIFYTIVIFMLICISSIQISQATNVTLHKLATQNMQTFSWEEPWIEATSFNEFINNALDDIINPSDQCKRRRAFEFFQNLEQTREFEQSCLLDAQTTWDDISLFKGKEDLTRYLATIIDRTQSELGRVALFQLLANPTSDRNILMQRQNIIRTFAYDTNLLNNMRSLLNFLEKSEKVVLAWWDKNPLKQTSRHCYFESLIGKPLNEYALALDGLSVYDRGWRLFFGAKSSLASIVLIAYGLLQLINVSSDQLNTQAHRLKPNGYIFKRLWNFDHHIVRGLTSIAMGIICSSCSLEFFKKFRTHVTIENCLHTLMGHVAQVINVMQSCKNIISAYPELSNYLGLQDLITFFDSLNQQVPEIQEFIQLLASDELQAKPSTFWLHGNTLRAYQLVEQVKDKLAPAFACIGKIDAFASLATLYQEFTSQRVQFSFVDFIDDQKPHLTCDNIWHPLLDPQSVITHSLTLGGTTQHRSAIITGPDQGGKSTLLKEVVFALIMAQSVGIAPASSMHLTPFSTIATHLSTNESQALKSTTTRIDHLFEHIMRTPTTSFHFFAGDKAFSNASPRDGEMLACTLAQRLSAQKNCISLMSTHFARVTQLAEESRHCITLKLPVHSNLDGSIAYSYQLEPGISTQDIALIMVP